MALTALEIYKLLPKTNCKDCGFPTCLAFAMQLAAGKATIELCVHASEEAKEKLGAAAAPPLPKVVVGTGERAVVLGDETVLFRHEKTFYHPTAIAVSATDAMEPAAFAARMEAIRALSFERVGQRISVDLVAVRCASGDPAKYARAAAGALEATGLPLALLAPAGPLAAATTLAVGDVILLEAGLSFLGLGVQPPTPSWGGVILDSKPFLVYAPWTSLPPGLAIVLTVLAVNLVGEALAQASAGVRP